MPTITYGSPDVTASDSETANFLSWLPKNGTRIWKYCQASTADLYTVPANKVFYLVNMTMSCSNTAGANQKLELYDKNAVKWFEFGVYTATSSALSCPFPIPIKFVAADKFTTTQNNTISFFMFGYEVDA